MRFRSAQTLRLFFCCLMATLTPSVLHAVDPPLANGGPRKSVKLLTIGNSYSNNMLSTLPQLSKAGGKELIVFAANNSGSSLADHAGKLKPGAAQKKGGEHIDKRQDLAAALASEQWDFVSIQQRSDLSAKAESFQPDGSVLVNAIHKYVPKAEILAYQTWSYPKEYIAKRQLSTDPDKMFKEIQAAYQKFADDSHAKVVPVGEAFQIARNQPNPIDLNSGDKHLNQTGQFLAAAVFYEILFDDSIESNPYKPNHVSPDDVKTLRHIAHEIATKAKQAAQEKR